LLTADEEDSDSSNDDKAESIQEQVLVDAKTLVSKLSSHTIEIQLPPTKRRYFANLAKIRPPIIQCDASLADPNTSLKSDVYANALRRERHTRGSVYQAESQLGRYLTSMDIPFISAFTQAPFHLKLKSPDSLPRILLRLSLPAAWLFSRG